MPKTAFKPSIQASRLPTASKDRRRPREGRGQRYGNDSAQSGESVAASIAAHAVPSPRYVSELTETVKANPTSAVGLIGEAEVAELLDLKPQTLRKWRLTHLHPLPWVKIGRAVRYKRQDVQKFIDKNTVTPQAAEVTS